MSEVKKVPEIRFAGFAEPWEQRKLGELSSSFEYGLNAAAKEYDGKNKYIRITDIDDDNREFKQENITSPDTDLSFAENYRLSEGDILFARTGASVGKSYIYKASDGLVYYAGFLIRARIKPEYNSEFVFQNTLTGDYEKFIKVTSMRSGQPGVNVQEYSQYQIMVPGKPEQDMISAYLQSLDNLIILHQRKHDKLAVLKKAMLEKMFPQDGNNVPEVRFAGFTGPWEQRKFEDIAVRSSTISSERGLPRIEYEDIVSGTGCLNKDVFAKKCDKAGIVFRKGDVLYGKLRPYLQNWLLPSYNGLAVGDFWVLQPQNTDSSFLYRLIQSRQFDEVANQSTGTKMPRADWKLVSKTEFLMPSTISEQAFIGTYFERLDNLIALHQRKHESLKHIKAALLQKMFV